MIPAREYLRSVEWIAAAWLVAILLVGLLTGRALLALRRRGWRRLILREDGAAYSLAYVLTLPLYLFLVAIVIEFTIVLIVKMGTVYAAFAAARSAVVFRSAEPARRENERATQAAIHAMTPFAPSSTMFNDGGSGGADGTRQEFLTAAAKRLPGGNVRAYLDAKFRYAAKATSVRLDPQGDSIRAVLAYRTPMYFPIVGRWFGGVRSPWGGRYRVLTVNTVVTLPDEKPQSIDGKLGIDYVSP